MSDYEVWCASCDVSFPVDSKRCLHCGGRTVADRPAKGLGGAPRFAMDSEAHLLAPISGHGSGHADEELMPLSTEAALAEAEEEQSPRRRGLRAGMSVVWMVLLAAGYIWQNCAGGPA